MPMLMDHRRVLTGTTGLLLTPVRPMATMARVGSIAASLSVQGRGCGADTATGAASDTDIVACTGDMDVVTGTAADTAGRMAVDTAAATAASMVGVTVEAMASAVVGGERIPGRKRLPAGSHFL